MSYEQPNEEEQMVLDANDPFLDRMQKWIEAIVYDIKHYGRVTRVSLKVREEVRRDMFDEAMALDLSGFEEDGNN